VPAVDAIQHRRWYGTDRLVAEGDRDVVPGVTICGVTRA
jgi:hypothetical protein